MRRSSDWPETNKFGSGDHGVQMNRIPTLLVATMFLSVACSQPPSETAVETTEPVRPTPVPLPQGILPDGFAVDLELATTPDETITGLMFRPSLPPDRGMLLLWTEERLVTIWMMNVLVPLDIVFLDNSGRIVELVEDARPCSAEPCPRFTAEVPSRAVLEIAAGGAAEHGLEVGLTISFERVPGYPAAAVE